MTAFRSDLHWLDYCVFSAMLVVSLGIGVYHALSGGRQRTTGEYLMGDRHMGLLPVTLSLTVTWMSTTTLLGYPAEMYAFGVQFAWVVPAFVIGCVCALVLFVPVFYPLQLTSINEYLYMRYQSKLVCYMGCICAVLAMVVSGGNVTYAPAAAIESVTGIPCWISMVLTSAVVITYSSIGGFKAVVWTDVWQALIMAVGVIIVLVQSLKAVGGFQRMWELNTEWGRTHVFDFDPDPTKRLNFYGAVFGNSLTMIAAVGYSQFGVQRYSSMPTMTKAKLMLLAVIPPQVILKGSALLTGLTVFAFYTQQGCDPVNGGQIASYNQVLTYFVSKVVTVPGITGLFIAAVYSAALSSASSCLNSSAACIWRDILKDKFPDISEFKATVVNKILTFVIGVLTLLLAFVFERMGGTLVQVIYTFSSASTAPVATLVLLGVFCPWVNWKGATVGSMVGLAVGIWISLGSYFSHKNWHPLPSPSMNCTLIDTFNTTTEALAEYTTGFSSTAAAMLIDAQPTGINRLYSLSFTWMRELFTGVGIVVSIVVSGLTGFRSPSTVEENLVHPWLRTCFHLKPVGHDSAIRKRKQGSFVYVPTENIDYSDDAIDQFRKTEKPSSNSKLKNRHNVTSL